MDKKCMTILSLSLSLNKPSILQYIKSTCNDTNSLSPSLCCCLVSPPTRTHPPSTRAALPFSRAAEQTLWWLWEVRLSFLPFLLILLVNFFIYIMWAFYGNLLIDFVALHSLMYHCCHSYCYSHTYVPLLLSLLLLLLSFPQQPPRGA